MLRSDRFQVGHDAEISVCTVPSLGPHPDSHAYPTLRQKIIVDRAVSATLAFHQSFKYWRKLVRTIFSPESSSCNLAKTARACLRVRLVRAALSCSSASFCALSLSWLYAVASVVIAKTGCEIF